MQTFARTNFGETSGIAARIPATADSRLFDSAIRRFVRQISQGDRSELMKSAVWPELVRMLMGQDDLGGRTRSQ